jgi:hypothetical protein
MESRSVEERLEAENFVLKEERINLRQKYDDVVGKNQRYRDKETGLEKRKAELKAEVACLESRNIKTIQELKDTAVDVTRIKARNAELEQLCYKQSDEIYNGQKRFDDYIQAVAHLSSQFRGRRPEPVTRRSSTRTMKSEGGDHDTEDLRPFNTSLLLPIPSMERENLVQREEKKPSEVLLHQETKSENRGQHDNNDLSKNTTAVVPNSRADRGIVPSVSGQSHREQHLPRSTSEQLSPRHNFTGTKECSRKRALLPDGGLDHSDEKRRRQEYPRCDASSPGKVTDPRLRSRRS